MPQDHLVAANLFGLPIDGVDAHGSTWTIRDNEGMWDSAPVRRSRVNKSQQDGAYESTSTLDAKGFTLEGVIRGLDHAGGMASKTDLLGLAAIREGILVWRDVEGTTYQRVELDDHIMTRPRGDKVWEWSLAVTAPDPARYTEDTVLTLILKPKVRNGEGWQYPVAYPIDWHRGATGDGTSNVVNLTNRGNAAWWPYLRIETTAVNPKVTCTNTGDWVQFNGQLGPGQWLDIDCQNRTVLLNGVTTQKWRTTWHGTWLAVPPAPPGTNTASTVTYQFTAATEDPNGVLTIVAKEGAWI